MTVFQEDLMNMTAYMLDEWFKNATPEERKARQERLGAAIKAAEAYREALEALAAANEPSPLSIGFYPFKKVRRLAQKIDRFRRRHEIISVLPGGAEGFLEPLIRRVEKKLTGESVTYLKLLELQLQDLRRAHGIACIGYDIMSMLGK